MVPTYTSAESAFKDTLLPNWTDESFIRSGRPLPRTELRPRELLGLIITCHLAKFLGGEDWLPGADPFGHDGAVIAKDDNGQGRGLVYEQVYAPHVVGESTSDSIKQAIHDAITSKASRGQAYVEDTGLIVLVSRNGRIDDLRQLAADVQKYDYETIYVISRNNLTKPFSYVCLLLKSTRDRLAPYEVDINPINGKAAVRLMTEE